MTSMTTTYTNGAIASMKGRSLAMQLQDTFFDTDDKEAQARWVEEALHDLMATPRHDKAIPCLHPRADARPAPWYGRRIGCHTIPRPSMMAIERVTNDPVETDSLALYKLTDLVNLAAFSCEARRTLECVHAALESQPKAQAFVSERVPSMNNWCEFNDMAGEVLQGMAMQLDKLKEAVSNRPFELQNLRGGRHEL